MSAVAERLRALAATRWIDRSDEATRAALTEGAAEVERLVRALADERDTLAFHVELANDALRDLHAVCDALGARARRSDPLPAVEELVGAAQALRARAEAPVLEVDALRALARGAQYREREALAQVEVLRARLDAAVSSRDVWRSLERTASAQRGEAVSEEREACAALCDAIDEGADCGGGFALECAVAIRARGGARAVDVLAASVGALNGVAAAGDLAGLGARAAGAVTRRQWRQCRRCVRCFWLTPDESVPEHQAQVMGAERVCGWTVTAKESE